MEENSPNIDPAKQEAEKQELIDTLQRIQAEFDNYRKRVQKDNETMVSLAAEKLVRTLLPVLDTFDLALKNKPDDGMEMLKGQLLSALEDAGLSLIETKGKFNPSMHEVLVTQESDQDNGTILEELQKGYKLGDKVIRHSKVKIARKRDDNAKQEEE